MTDLVTRELLELSGVACMKLSRNYSLLFDLVCAGHDVLAFVDYRWHGDGPETEPLRDPCSVRRHGEWKISIAARGICYGGLYPFQKEKAGRTEREQFIAVCEHNNIEFHETAP